MVPLDIKFALFCARGKPLMQKSEKFMSSGTILKTLQKVLFIFLLTDCILWLESEICLILQNRILAYKACLFALDTKKCDKQTDQKARPDSRIPRFDSRRRLQASCCKQPFGEKGIIK